MNAYDVIVVGGRVAGASTATLLARAGLSVALLDRSSYGSDTLSTHGLMRGGVLQLSRWGLLDDVVATGAPAIRRVLFHYADGETTQVSIRPARGVPALFAPRRKVLDRLLVDAAADAGSDVLHDASVTGLLRDDRGGVLGVRARVQGRTTELLAAITIGADGIRSTVARDAGARTIRRGLTASAVLYRYVPGLPTAGFEWSYGAAAAAGLIPTNDGETCVFVGTTPHRMKGLRRAGTEAAFASVFAQAAPWLIDRLAAAGRGDRVHGWAGVPGFIRQSWGPGWALVGDAGYFKDPITAHGMTDALRDAELLAQAVLAALSGERSQAAAFTAYQTTRDQLSNRLFVATEAVASYDWDLCEVRGLLRQVSSAMSDEVDHLQGLPTPIGAS